MSKTKDYLTSENFDLLFEDELNVLDMDYQYEDWKLQQEAAEGDIAFGL